MPHWNNNSDDDNRFTALYPGLTGWAGTRRDIHPLIDPDHHPTFISFFNTLYKLPFIPLHLLRTHFWQLIQWIELLPTPLPQTPSYSLCVSFWRSPLIITLVLFILTLMPLFSTLSFHSLSLVIETAYQQSLGRSVDDEVVFCDGCDRPGSCRTWLDWWTSDSCTV